MIITFQINKYSLEILLSLFHSLSLNNNGLDVLDPLGCLNLSISICNVSSITHNFNLLVSDS